MYDRAPRDRVAKVAPYLTLDGDPYPSLVDGRMVWIVDGYTSSNKYPYSALRSLSDATSDSITASTRSVTALAGEQVNYIRNSVKATVDAYDGSVTLYAWDETDPVLQAWRKVFPSTVKPLADISGDLMSHLRYPEDLFKVQRSLLARYHVTDAASFFSGGDFWQVPPEPTAANSGTAPRQPPYYLSIAMPGQDEPRFSLTSSFIPPEGGRNTLKGYLAVDADAGATAGEKRGDYGTLRLLQLPTDSIKGPGQMQNDFNANPTVTTELALLRGGASGASDVELGNMLVLPVAGGLLYVQPVYVRARGETSYPLLQRVLVGYGQQIGFAATLGEALNQVFGTTGGANVPATDGGTTPPAGDTGGTGTDAGSGTAQAQLQAALTQASQAIKDSDEALASGDFTAYGEAQQRLKAAVARATAAEAQIAGAAPAPAATPSPAPSPSPSG